MMPKYAAASIVAAAVLLLFQCSLAEEDANTVSHHECEQDDETCKMSEEVFDVFGAWMDGVSDEAARFLDENVFRQEGGTKSETGKLVPAEKKNQNNNGFAGLIQETQRFFIDVFQEGNGEETGNTTEKASSNKSITDGLVNLKNVFADILTLDERSNQAIEAILEQARLFSTASKMKRNYGEIFKVFQEAMTKAADSFEKHFGHIEFKSSLPISLWYWMEQEDEVKTASWKRREHRFYKDVNVDTVLELHDALYLSHLSYVDTVEELQDGLKDFAYPVELIYFQSESFPGEPAHFVALVKESKEEGFKFPWQVEDALDVVMAVRGTKELGDVLSDVIMDATTYRGGHTHEGVAASGLYLFNRHFQLMKQLLEVSGRSKVRLWLVGHSLGAGAASIAAIEFNDHDFIDARAVGFGCPALLTKDLSESTKDFVTTVITDSDVVPRMSGAAVANVILDVMSYDWTARALVDTKQLLKAINENLFFNVNVDDILAYVEAHFDEKDRPYFEKVTKARVEPVLIPPGNCIHVYRDGVGFAAKFTPCTFFNTIDVTRTMLLDHLSDRGYHRALLNFVRDQLDDLNFSFRHDLLAVPA